MNVVIFADRPGRALAPLSQRTCVALLPVVGKPLIEHTIESVAAAGIREVLIVVGPHADAVERALGDGTRWGVRCAYVLSRGNEAPATVLARLGSRLRGDCLLVRGDVLRSPVIAAFLDHAAAHPDDSVGATIDGVPAGLCLLRNGGDGVSALPGDPEVPGDWHAGGTALALERAKLSLIDSLVAYHRANLDAAAGCFRGLIIPGRTVGRGLIIGRQSRVAPEALTTPPLFIGSRCEVKAGAEMLGDVVLANDVVVDRRATLRSAVILPHTYVGELVEIADAIVWANELIHVDTGAVTHVRDAFLLSDLTARPWGTLTDLGQRLLGVCLLLGSLPLWPLVLVASLLAQPRAPFRTVRLVGNRVESGDDGRPRRQAFTAIEAATEVPILRHLPKLLAVAAGQLRLVGVSPLTPEQASAPAEVWERVRDEAPAGLIGPSLGVSADAPEEERRLVEAYYTRTRSVSNDLRWLLRGAAALFSPRAWQWRFKTEKMS